ncbi:TPA: hypothetical protein KWY89_004211 [Escherichia coli]|nr:hypothetical protein [Escherichia coli]ELH6241439.1 hypothetical protein [Escherichia coli]HBH7337673.1 hypothetical protein [Escherichia coli]HCP1722929.1 hypothetical protein [Escherichia coli]
MVQLVDLARYVSF